MVEVDGDRDIAANDVSGEWIADEDIIRTGVALALWNYLLKLKLLFRLKRCLSNFHENVKNGKIINENIW